MAKLSVNNIATFSYDQLKQKLDSGGGLSSAEGVAAVPAQEVSIPELPPVEFPMEDLTYSSNIPGTAQDLNQVLGLRDGNGSKQNNFAGSQLILNSDRVMLNARQDFLMLFGQQGVAIASPSHVNIDADESVTIFGEEGLFLGVPGKGDAKGNSKAPKTKGDPTIDNEYEPLVLGTKLANLIEDLLVVLKNATILTPVGKGYFREDVMYELACLQSRIPEILSTYGYIDGVSHEAVDPQPQPPGGVSTNQETTPTGTTVGSSTEPTTTTPAAPSQQISNSLSDTDEYYKTNNVYNDPL